jgi:SAM-dependent methyltransferase
VINRERLEELCEGESVEFKRLVATYVGEALFFEKILLEDLSRRSEARQIIEVGAGVGLLSLVLARAGYQVVAFEPESAGFSEMRRIRDYLLRSWEGDVPTVTWVDGYLERDLPQGIVKSDFGVALNVLEHVPDTDEFLQTVMDSLKDGASFRMIFPNYRFPYEPHFNFPTLFSKRLTYRLWRKKIETSKLPNPVGMWNDLSWPTLRKVKKCARASGLDARFSRGAVAAYLDRINNDTQFLERKGAAGKFVFRPTARLARLVLPMVPKSALPILDVTFSKR